MLLAAPGLLAAASGWARVRDVMTHPDDAIGILVTVVDLGRRLARRARPRGRRRGDPGGRLDARVDPAGGRRRPRPTAAVPVADATG